MNQIKQIYDILAKFYAPQHWWPVTSKGKANPEYCDGPKNEKQELEVIFGAILTQNTSWKNVEKAIINLNKKNLMDAIKIIEIDNKNLAEMIKSSGYHNQKAKKLKNFCAFLLKNYNGSLKNLFGNELQKLRDELLSVNGIGPETADSIILYAAKKPIFVVDAYTGRIWSRITYDEKNNEKSYEGNYGKLQKLFMESLEQDTQLFNEYHALLVELGKNICKKKPLCENCPLNEMCGYAKNRHF